jgi:hydroxymethylpyrimidine/phosphomethylpyrimidine kinase
VKAVLTIAGSDSGGGAGIQADLKAFQALGVFGASAITCVTAQNPDGVAGVAALEPDMVSLQVRTVCEGFPVAAAKTGMLFSSPIIQAVAETVCDMGIPALVVDPVMVATSGSRLLRDDAVAVLRKVLLPLATVTTPNLPEAEILWGRAIDSLEAQKEAARGIGDAHGIACVVKGGHREAGRMIDVLYADGEVHTFETERVEARETHGTGCTFAAALAAFLARGEALPAAVRRTQQFVSGALRGAVQVGRHRPLAPASHCQHGASFAKALLRRRECDPA